MSILKNLFPPKKLLIVDDEGSVLVFLRRILTHEHYEIEMAQNYDEAIDKLHKHTFDCIITDAMMPGRSGYELIEEIKKHSAYSNLPLVMLTRRSQPEDVKKAIELGVSDYIVKPIDEQLLLNKLKSIFIRNDGKKTQFFEVSIDNGYIAKAELFLDAEILSLSEVGVLVRSQVPFDDGLRLRLQGNLFTEIDIHPPILKVRDCKKIQEGVFEANLLFVAIKEQDLQRIRTWIRKEAFKHKQGASV